MKVSNAAFLAFGGVPDEVLIDNARALVAEHRARTKGKSESGVGYVKRNAIAEPF